MFKIFNEFVIICSSTIRTFQTHSPETLVQSRRLLPSQVQVHVTIIILLFKTFPSHWVLTNCEPASQRVMRVEPASHASHASHHVSHARQMLVPSPFSFLRLLAAFGYLARVFAILALLSISFCYLPSSFSSFVKVNYPGMLFVTISHVS